VSERQKIMKSIVLDEVGPQRKIIHKANSEEVDKAVYRWFVDTNSKNILVNGPLLCQQT
jgi:hypothetical protein